MPKLNLLEEHPAIKQRRKSRLLILGVIVLVIIAGIVIYKLFSSSTAVSGAGESTPCFLGANLNGITDWSVTPVFTDLINQARTFGSPTQPWVANVAIGDDGWPLGDFGVVLMTVNYVGVGGNYTVSFNGQATVSLIATKAVLGTPVYNAETNLTTVIITYPEDGNNFMLGFTGTGSGIKNLKVVRPGYDPLNPPLFTNEFLNYITRFKTLRFMDWLATNGNPCTSWDSRATPYNSHGASPKGVPWEYIIELANQASKDIWINIPVSATEDYITQLATLLLKSLKSGLKVYVEYSNELWNSQFPQFNINSQLARAEIAANSSSPLNYDGQGDQWGFRRTANQLKNISDIFRSVWGNAAINTVIRPVLAGQIVNSYIVTDGLAMIDAVYGPPSNYFYAIAGAPYFNLGTQQTVDGLTSEQILQALNSTVSNISITNQFEQNAVVAHWYGLSLLAYEGGPDTFGAGSVSAKNLSQSDPLMGTICTNYLNTWYQQGGEMFMWFVGDATTWTTNYGTWGLTYDITVMTPKLQCIDQMLANGPPAPAIRNNVPGTINALAYSGNYPPYSYQYFNGLWKGSTRDYLLNVVTTKSYNLVLTVNTQNSGGNLINLSVDGSLIVGNMSLPQVNTFTNTSAIPMNLTSGLHTMRIQSVATTSNWTMSTFIFQ